MTYREAIQIQIKALQDIYDNAEGLRDVADDDDRDGKEAWNNVRRLLPNVWGPLQKLDNALTDSQAQYPLRGNYSITVTPEAV